MIRVTARPRLAGAIVSALVLALLALPTPAQAQFGGIGKKLKQKAEQKVDQRTDEAAQKTVDAADESVRCAASDKACQTKARKEGKTVVTGDADSDGASDGAAGAAGAADDAGVPGKGAFVNFDFKPGERPLYVNDFTKDEVGDFPRRLELREGNFEVVEWKGKRLLRGTSFGGFYIDLPEVLPERFTMEFEFQGPSGWHQAIVFNGESNHGENNIVNFGTWDGGIAGTGVRSVSEMGRDGRDRLFPIRIMADGKYVKVYMDDKRVANVPNANLGRAKRIYVEVAASDDSPAYYGNFRVMAGGKKLYDALASEGRVATQGIYFDTGSDRIRGESNGTLKEIATMLQEHGDLKLTIEGHTDNVGAAAANLTLSQKRAEAVKAALASTYGIDAGRLTAKGLGATKPAASNDTAEGRQSNRRVELVKM